MAAAPEMGDRVRLIGQWAEIAGGYCSERAELRLGHAGCAPWDKMLGYSPGARRPREVGQLKLLRRVTVILVTAGMLALATRAAPADAYFLTVAGLGGEPDYEQRFTGLAADLDRLFKGAGAAAHVFTLSGKEATRAHLAATLQAIAAQANPEDDFVLTLIGHGTYDGVEYKFNLVGPDISAAGLAQLCDRISSKRQLIVNTTSSSGASVAALAKKGRAVIAATKSGTEKNATVFARYWVEALQDPTADLDKNDAISALEAFQYASAKTAAFYESQKRLATEHAVFADTGTGAAVRVASTAGGAGRELASMRLVGFGSERTAASDPAKRGLLARKQQLEQKIDTLKLQRAALSPQEYKQQLTESLVALAKVQEELDK
jgi:hypothetical protein